MNGTLPTSGRFRWLLAALLMTPLWGCARDFTVRLDAADKMGTPSVEVHIVGVRNAGEYRRWRDLSMSDYWADVKLDDKVKVMKFGEGLSNPQVLSTSDVMWKSKWRGAKLLMVLSSFPPSKDLPGDADARRLILPLKWRKWSGSGPVPIVIRPTGVRCDLEYEPWNPFED